MFYSGDKKMKPTQNNWYLVLTMMAVVGVTASTANAQQLIGWWKFDETAGSVAYDAAGLNDGLFYGSGPQPAWVTDPVRGSVLYFTGGTGINEAGGAGVVDFGIDTIYNFNTGTFSAGLWAKVPGHNQGTWAYMLSRSDGNNWRVGRYSSDDFLRWTGGDGSAATYTSGNAADNQWHFYVWTYDGTTFRLYDNGVEVDSEPGANPREATSALLRLGGRGGSNQAQFYADDLFFFKDVTLTPQQIQDLHNGTATPATLMNFPPFADAGPDKVVIQDKDTLSAEVDVDGCIWDPTPWPPENPVAITATWSVLAKPTSAPDPVFLDGVNSATNTIQFQVQNPAAFGAYTIKLTAGEPGMPDRTDVVEFIVQPWYYTGLQNHWAFDGDLQDTALIDPPYSTNNDYLESRGVLAPFYGAGIVGSAVHVGHTDFADNWCWLETFIGSDSPDLELNRAFTVEMYVNPQIDKVTPETDRLEWQDLVGKWFDYTPGQETHFESYEFVLNYGYPRMNVADISDITPPRSTDNVKSGVPLDPYAFPRIDGWQHLAFTGDGAGNIAIYIDGIKQGCGTLPNTEFVNSIAPLRIANVLVNANGVVGRPSPYVGWIDELKFYEFNQSPEYFLERARLIPIQGPEPVDGWQFAKPDVVLAWAPVKGYPGEIPTYDVWFARDGQSLTEVASGITDTFYDPEEAGGAPLLNFETTYNWKVIAHHSAGTTGSDEWSFKTIAEGFLGEFGTALIAHWKFDEGAGTDAHDSAGCDDVARYVWADTSEPVLPDWIPGWTAINPASAIDLPGMPKPFGYFEVDACDPETYINLPQGDYTLWCWMRTTPEFVNDDADFIGFGASYGIGRDESSQVVEFYHGDVAGGATSGTTPVGDGYWHHVAAVYKAPTRSGDDGLCSIYVDGCLDATEKVDDNHFIDRLAQLRLGGNSREAYNFTGALDDVRIYRRALSEAEINDIPDPVNNHPPAVHTGDNTIIIYPEELELNTTIREDGLPLFNNPRLAWTVLSGPGTVTIDPCIVAIGQWPAAWPEFDRFNDNVVTTTMTFSQPGFYNLRLKADDAIYTHADDIMVWVQPAAGMDRTVAYWRFEQDQKETDYPKTIDGDDPNTLIIANEIPDAPALIATRDITAEVPQLHDTIPLTPIPLTGADNLHHLGEGVGERDFWGARRAESGYDINLEAESWPGLVFCADALTIEFWIKSGDQTFTALDLLDGGKGIQVYRSTASPSDGLRLECYLETEVPNQYEHVILVTDIMLTTDQWIHIAVTYEKATGIFRIFADGVPAWITNYYYQGAWTETNPWITFFDGPDHHALVLPDNLDLLIAIGNNTQGSAIDELRITAETLYPPKFLLVGPTLCAPPIPADLNNDCNVDLVDFMLFCNNWLLCNNANLSECFKNP